jgi:two-component system CheB/CheR fusion protein
MLMVKHFTNNMTVISRLIPSDVGRPITDIASDLIYPKLTEDVRYVQRTLITVEKQIMSRNGSWFIARIIPYHTLEDKIDGVVITFVNITKSKVKEAEMNKAKITLEQRIVDKDEELLLVNNKLHDEEQQSHGEIAVSKDMDNKL